MVLGLQVRMVGEFLVTRPEDGVIGETPDIFPAASDYHLVCLQHDDSASMIIDGAHNQACSQQCSVLATDLHEGSAAW